MTATRVLVTGLGTTSPVGGDVTSTWSALLAGQSGVDTLKHDWAEELGTQIAAEVAVEPDRRARPRQGPPARPLRPARAGRRARGVGATPASPATTRRRSTPSGSRVAMASGIGGVQTLLSNYDALQGQGPAAGLPAGDPDAHAERPRGRRSASHVGAKAGVHTPVSACASGNEAIALGIDLIRLGRADVVVVGGTEAAIHAAADGRLRADDGAVQAQRRARAGLPSVGQGPRRLRARRGRGRAGPRVRGARHRRAAPGCTPRRPAPGSPPTPTTSPSPTRRGSAPPGR